MNNETIQKLEGLKADVKQMPSVKGKQEVFNKIKSSILFLQIHKVDRKTTGLILAAREKDVENIGKGKEHKQVEIDWRVPKMLRSGGIKTEIEDDDIPF